MNTQHVVLKMGREQSVLKSHPWIFSGGIAQVAANSGDIVDIYDGRQTWLAKGYYHSKNTIACRILTRNPDEQIDEVWLLNRLRTAYERRKQFIVDTNAFRLVFGEADELPGLIVDIYDQVAVMQISTLGMEQFRQHLVNLLPKVLDLVAIYERSDIDGRSIEGLKEAKGLLWGKLPEVLTIFEGAARFVVDVEQGQKTGFFLDQRANRQGIGRYVKGKKVLNTFSYTGAFSVHAGLAGAKEITSVDSSRVAIDQCKLNMGMNEIASTHFEVCEDVFHYLKVVDQKFDVIILDPPGMVKSKKDLQAGTNAYRVLHQLALKKLLPGGILITSSCSGWVDRLLFHKLVFWACEKEGRNLRMIEEHGHTWDHPLSIFFPEGEYLKYAVYQQPR